MKTYDVICPECGHVNRSLYLDETDGWMECENCQTATRITQEKNLAQSKVLFGLNRQAVTA